MCATSCHTQCGRGMARTEVGGSRMQHDVALLGIPSHMCAEPVSQVYIQLRGVGGIADLPRIPSRSHLQSLWWTGQHASPACLPGCPVPTVRLYGT